MSETTWLSRTRQSLKIYVFFVLIGGAGVMLWLLVRTSDPGSVATGNYSAGVAIGLVSFGVTALAWLVFSIRCFECGKRPVPHLLRTVEFSEWLTILLRTTKCPCCGGQGPHRNQSR